MNGCKCQNKLRYDGAYYVVLPLNTKNERERVSSIALYPGSGSIAMESHSSCTQQIRNEVK